MAFFPIRTSVAKIMVHVILLYRNYFSEVNLNPGVIKEVKWRGHVLPEWRRKDQIQL